MNPCTSLILHPHFLPWQLDDEPCIENDGPDFELLSKCQVHLRKGVHMDFFMHEDRTDFPDRAARSPELENVFMLDARAARRCIGLLESAPVVTEGTEAIGYFLTEKHRAELLWPLAFIFPDLEHVPF